jgi:hypothetical protein
MENNTESLWDWIPNEIKIYIETFCYKDEDLNEVKSKCWKINNLIHRDNDLPAVIWANGRKDWYINGKTHRNDGPAVILENGDKMWD